MIQPAMIDPPARFQRGRQAGRPGSDPAATVRLAGDINRLILYLLEGTNFVTGVCFRVDGGRFLGEDG